ncbi:secretory phospholipase A2 receptor-like isoform X2 [Poecilia reticulata]|uniref:secretory phospholipase A2 receptor-like isoform X2 n=1 Tax=Poecilia reticulata TaxID=8081 RepID=UPI0007EB96CE|nr:PREDICTED: secretory phospholipase A2 receptor-like isoform X2 [Poecilia reticulata]
MMKVLFLVLCSAAYRLRYFNNSEVSLNWTDAEQYCVEEGGSLLSLYDEEDERMMFNYTSWFEGPGFWLGLKKKDNDALFWSDGEIVNFTKSTVNVSDGDQLCEAFKNGSWMGFKCSEEKAFMCKNGENFVLVDDVERNWCQALQHCRTHFSDLASIMDEQQNEDLRQKSLGKTVMIGLQHDNYERADKSCSTFRNISNSPECVSLHNNGNELTWTQQNCANIKPVICYKGHVRAIVIKEPKTWEDALNYCKARHSRFLLIEDEEDQEAVGQWLKYTVTGSLKRLWIGLRQSSVFGFWIWSDRIANYKNWENGKQPEMPLSHHCGVIDAKTYKWNDEDCNFKLPFLCEEDIIYMKT